ncbi:MAG: hypothetical protein HQL24_09990 [Candidatus Omnitrophica bacterium]|nr:hypothetical protein [Candidatus Omnitrophota bacterium]
MSVKKRTHNPRLIRSRRTYTAQQIAILFNIHLGTVRLWIKQGMRLLNPNSRPYYIMGIDLIAFLKTKKTAKRKKLQEDEFYCVRCRCGRKSLPDRITVEVTNKRLGQSARQIIIRGICPDCGTRIIRFSSDKNTFWKPTLPQEGQVLIGNIPSPVNIDITKETKE